MTEVRESSMPGGAMGLFATKAYAKGELILEENPLVVLAPISTEEDKSLMMDLLVVGEKKIPALSKKQQKQSEESTMTLWDTIQLPSSSALSTSFRSTYRGMVQAGMCWMKRQSSLSKTDRESLEQLYHPKGDSLSSNENGIVDVATKAVDYLKEQEFIKSAQQKFEDWDGLKQIVLIWACNAFQGGRIYSQVSRVNHSCDPNAIVQTTNDNPDSHEQRLVAATDIAIGEEITISYLGLFMYAETSVRKQILEKTKFFTCQCERCSNQNDPARQIPCPTCHPRELPHQSLEEDVQYDDDQTVQYTTEGSICPKCKITADDKKLHTIMENVTKKVVATLDNRNSLKTTNNSNNNDDDEDEEEDTILEEHVGLACSIMGDRHWTTNVLKLLLLDRRLSLISQAMLATQELPEMSDVAEAIDSLQRIERFVQSLELKLDAGHILGDVIIGIARTLVSLGDVKSQKYGAEWLEKVTDYVNKFESEGRQKVVAALKVAWKKHGPSGEVDQQRAAKKSKSS